MNGGAGAMVERDSVPRVMSFILAALLLLAGCAAAPDMRESGVLGTRLAAPAPSLAVTQGLALPARIGLVRVVGGRPTPVPAAERSRLAGALVEINRRLLYPLHLVALPVPAAVLPAAMGVGQGASAPALLAPLLDAAARAGLDAVLVYELATRVENDRAVAALADLALLGGIVPGTVTSEGHGTAIALLIDPRSGATIGHATARMADRPLADLRRSGGDPRAVADLADYAMLHMLTPPIEDMLTGAVSGRLR